MEIINIDLLCIPENRQRKEFPAAEMDELSQSILMRGLLHPPVVRNDGITLVAGERRTRSIKALQEIGLSFYCNGQRIPPGFIPVTKLADLSELEVREAELEENLIRLDLTWQDRAQAIADLHKLRTEQAALAGTTHTVSATAQEVHGPNALGAQIQSTTEAILLQEHLDNPLVATAKSQKEAVKIIRKLKEAEHRERLAAEFDLSTTRHTVLQGDMRTLAPTIASESIDCILTDPPYGVGADTFGDMSDCGHNYRDDWPYALEIYETVATEGFRIAKAEAHLYTFCDITHFQKLVTVFANAGWKVWPKPLIWSKGNGMLPRPEHGPRYSYETILFASKGDRKTLKVANDVITLPPDTGLLHGAQKPVDLYVELLSRSVLPGSTVLDFCGGSGTILPAADVMSCVATMMEAVPENYATAVSRLNKQSDQFEFPL